MRRGETIKRLLFHTHRNATEMSVVFHQAVTGVDVSAGGDGANAMDFGVCCFGCDLLDRHERPAGDIRCHSLASPARSFCR